MVALDAMAWGGRVQGPGPGARAPLPPLPPPPPAPPSVAPDRLRLSGAVAAPQAAGPAQAASGRWGAVGRGADAFFDHAATQVAAELPAFPLPGPLGRPLGILGVSAGAHAAFRAAQEADFWGVAEGLGNAAYCLADALNLDWSAAGRVGAPLNAWGKLGAGGAVVAGAIGSVQGAKALLAGQDEEGQPLRGLAKATQVLTLSASLAQVAGGALFFFPAGQVAGLWAIALGGVFGLGAIGTAQWPTWRAKLAGRSAT